MTKLRKAQLKRVKSFIRRAEKRGYEFTKSLKENLSQLSTRKLKSLTPKELYKQSTSKKFGVELSGTRTRELERSLAGKKASATKARKRFYKEHPTYQTTENESYEDTVLTFCYNLCDEYQNSDDIRVKNGAISLRKILDSEVNTYGRYKVAMVLEQNATSAKWHAEKIIFESNDQKIKDHIIALVMIIRGYIPTIEEMKPFAEYMDNMDSSYMQNESEEV